MFVGAALLGIHMALTHSTITAMVAYYMLLVLPTFTNKPTVCVTRHTHSA
jgi:hypothetical protein